MDVVLAAELKTFARETLGFDLVGITHAGPVAHAGTIVAWVAAGRHGEMAYMARTAATRGDPRAFLAGARSVLSVAMSYHDPPEPPELEPRAIAVVARYARRADYHRVLKRRLVRLGRVLHDRRPGTRWRIGVDTAPLAEKELAERAGLGWIGKNTCLVNRRLGSELLLGELVTDVELPPDLPASRHCGRCTACLDACPCGALVAPGTLDARRCTSYLTIEHRGEIEQSPGGSPTGAHLFGCDVCQAVCPWNTRAPVSCAEPLRPRPGLDRLVAAELVTLDAADWSALAAGTPLRRLPFPRFRRNLALVTRFLARSLTFSGEGNIKRAPEGSKRPRWEV